MNYAITRSILGFTPTIELSHVQYDRLCKAKRGVILALGFEERFEILRENYADYERELFDVALKGVLYLDGDWGRLISELFALNRRLLNVLASARLYNDHVNSSLIALFGPGSVVVDSVQTARAREEHDCFAFRLMEALRNYTQHNGLPIYQLGRPSETDLRKDGSRKLRHRATPRLSVDALSRDKKRIGLKLLDELRAYATEKNDLVPVNEFVRGYIQSLGRIHKSVRDAIEIAVQDWDATIIDALRQAKEAFHDDSCVVVGCYYEDTDDELSLPAPPKEEDLFLDPINRRKHLQSLTSLAHLMPGSQDYVSSE